MSKYVPTYLLIFAALRAALITNEGENPDGFPLILLFPSGF